jgi:uncharacterized repeat protein (TIGR01451 family)
MKLRRIPKSLYLILIIGIIVESLIIFVPTKLLTQTNSALDLIFLIDTTGSMGDDIAYVKRASTEIVNTIDSKITDYRIAVVDYEDFPVSPYGSSWCGDYMYHDVLSFSTDKTEIVSAIQGLPIRCGGDWEESVYSALMHSIDASSLGDWRENVKRVIILMGDAPPHDPEPFTEYTLSDVTDEAVANGVSIYSIVTGGGGGASVTYGYFSRLAEETDGQVFTAPTASEVVDAILEAIEEVIKDPVIVSKSKFSIKLGESISSQLETAFGTPPFTWSVVEGSPPPGISLSSDGVLSGTPTEVGEFTFKVRATDSKGKVVEKSFTIKVVTVFLPDVRIEKIGTTPVPGRILDYFILVRNVGDAPATDIEVLEILNPQQFTLVSVNPPAVTDISTLAEASLILWNIDKLNPGEIRIFSYQVRLDPSTPIGAQVVGGPACSGLELLTAWASCVKEAIEAIPKCALCVTPCAACKTMCAGGPKPCLACLGVCIGCIGGVSCAGEALDMAQSCFDAVRKTADCAETEQEATRPVDPNEKVVIAERFIQPDQPLVYVVHFENIGEVEALDVFITDVLDPNLDISTLEILTPGGTFDPDTRTLKWELIGRNLLPGETDNVMFSIKPLPDLPSGTEIKNTAKIQFEIFEPLITPEVVNIIDITSPSCTMNPLPDQTSSENFRISWSGRDEIGGIEFYSIFVSVDGEEFKPFIERTEETSAMFNGEIGKKYEFFCAATDTAGNVETQALIAETSIRIVPSALPGDLDGDNDVDRNDLNILLQDRNKPVSESSCGEDCDLDGDGKITGLDARKLVLLCTRPRCATE